MTKPEHVAISKAGVPAWNEWRSHHHGSPSLRGAKLYRAQLQGIDLNGADLRAANLRRANLEKAELGHAHLQGADLRGANLAWASAMGARLNGANLLGAGLIRAYLADADLRAANLRETNLSSTTLSFADLRGADLTDAVIGSTDFGGADLSGAIGLDTCLFRGPGVIDPGALKKSGMLPINFLRGCGLPDSLIDYLPSLLEHAIQFYSCFISYSHADKSFARRLHDTLQGRGIRCWLDEKQLLPGHDIYDEVDRGIRLWDKILLCCSEHSLTSWWVDNEIGTALEKEQRLTKERGTKVHAIIPLNMDGCLFTDAWKSGYRAQIRRRLAADFTGWQTEPAKFDVQVERVVRALRADGSSREKRPERRL